MNVTRVAHVSVNVVDDLDAHADFFASVLGLAPLERPEIPGVAGRWFDIGDVDLHLVDAKPREQTSNDIVEPDSVGDHFCVYVDDLDVAVAELEARHITMQRGVQHQPQGPVVQIWIAAPNGYTIELQQDPNTAR
jgi:catechol 2,3-dioxygenase-like lactoylglutathione lyase family enzyme